MAQGKLKVKSNMKHLQKNKVKVNSKPKIKKGKSEAAPKKEHLKQVHKMKKDVEKAIKMKIEKDILEKTATYDTNNLRILK
ncbi:hypothetical protein Ciccas_009060 [Cichlidogyrus casuarinus]|uniref:Uncharacterized protein n=1 Tax=Cichlidogyrus casuarinus TaxID=1844966 RepID=A0ABD2PY59_9PLAT